MIKPLGKTTAISVADSSTTAVTVGGTNVADYASKAAFYNAGATTIAIMVAPLGKCPAAVLPVDGTPSATNIVLPPTMHEPWVFAVPAAPFDVRCIGSAAGPGIVYITPCEE